MPLMKSVAGDMEVSIEAIRAEKSNLVAVGKFGVWEAEIILTPTDVVKMIPLVLKGGVIGYILKLPYIHAKSKIKKD